MRPVVLVLLLAAAGTVWASCEGQGCPEQAAAARAAGLLGSSTQQLRSCTPRTFPTQGSLEAVRARKCRRRCQRRHNLC